MDNNESSKHHEGGHGGSTLSLTDENPNEAGVCTSPAMGP